MSITTYSELQTAVGNWIARDDLSAYVPDWITLFEAMINRRLRVRNMETATALTTTSGVASLPTDYLAWRRVTWTGNHYRELEYVHPSYLRARQPATTGGLPTIFTIEGASLIVDPVDDTSTVSIDYYQKVPALSVSNTTNWLLTAHPDLYLFGALTESGPFINSADSFALWKSRRDEIIAEIERLDFQTSAPSATRVMGMTP